LKIFASSLGIETFRVRKRRRELESEEVGVGPFWGFAAHDIGPNIQEWRYVSENRRKCTKNYFIIEVTDPHSQRCPSTVVQASCLWYYESIMTHRRIGLDMIYIHDMNGRRRRALRQTRHPFQPPNLQKHSVRGRGRGESSGAQERAGPHRDPSQTVRIRRSCDSDPSVKIGSLSDSDKVDQPRLLSLLPFIL